MHLTQKLLPESLRGQTHEHDADKPMSTQEPSATTESQPTQSQGPTQSAGPTHSPGRTRRLGLFGLGAVVVLSGLGYLGYWFFDGRYYESTDDAYVNGEVVQVTSALTGTVIALNLNA